MFLIICFRVILHIIQFLQMPEHLSIFQVMPIDDAVKTAEIRFAQGIQKDSANIAVFSPKGPVKIFRIIFRLDDGIIDPSLRDIDPAHNFPIDLLKGCKIHANRTSVFLLFLIRIITSFKPIFVDVFGQIIILFFPIMVDPVITIKLPSGKYRCCKTDQEDYR